MTSWSKNNKKSIKVVLFTSRNSDVELKRDALLCVGWGTKND